MITKIIEATNNDMNWGKFMLCRFTKEEFEYKSQLPNACWPVGRPLLRQIGWDEKHLWVLDLQTGEGALFLPGGHASYDLNQKHKIWVCPLFEPFLSWLYKQDLSDLEKLPAAVNLPDAIFEFRGHRREGKQCLTSQSSTAPAITPSTDS